MKKTSYYGLLKPEGTDAVDIQNFNDNFDTIDNALHDAADASGDLSNGVVYANVAATRTQIESGNTLGVIIGKVIKWFADLKDAAFAQIANNDTTTASGYVADARIVKTHGDEIDTLNTKNGGLYFGQNSAGKWGYKTSANGTVNPFRNPAGNAVAGDVLAGKTFANADSDSVTGTMINNGVATKNITPSDASTTELALEGYYAKGSKVVADGSVAYNAGFTAGADFKTVKLGSSTSNQAVTFDISEYKDKPHVCYAVVTGGHVGASSNAGSGSAGSDFGGMTITENGVIVTYSATGGSCDWSPSSGAGVSGYCRVYFDAYIAYTG